MGKKAKKNCQPAQALAGGDLRRSGWSGIIKASQQKGGQAMPTENERKDIQKAMAYDLLRIFEQTPDKVYTPKEIKDLIDAYITGLNQ